MKTTMQGNEAEAAVAEWLGGRGFEVLGRNWRTRFCEIDLIVKKDKVIYFVEVKYRRTDSAGDGFSYITPKKQRQMKFAAEVWIMENDWDGDWRLVAAAVDEGYDSVQIVEV